MTLPKLDPVQESHRTIMRDHGLVNCKAAILAREKVGIPLPAACALLSMESGGKNIYGHDAGGAMSFPNHDVLVTEKNFQTFLHQIQTGHTSNGVGPCQITWSGYFPAMAKEGLKPWIPYDNMRYGFGILKGHFEAAHSWQTAAQQYNGTGVAAAQYGRDFEVHRAMWEHLLP